MSPNRHVVSVPIDTGPTAMVLGAVPLAPGVRFDDHRHDSHQIAWASTGVLTIRIADRQWVLPPTRALWIPADVAHQTGSLRGAQMRGIYIAPSRSVHVWSVPTLVSVTALLHHLFDHLTTGVGPDADARRRVEAVVFDLLTPTGVPALTLRWPRDARARIVADAIAAHPGDQRTLEQHAAVAGLGERSVARAFLADTGITFGRWRTHLRLAAALPLLAERMTVTRVSQRVGYATPSAFVAAFTRELGVSPGAYFD